MTASFREVAVSAARRAGALLQASLGRAHRIEQKDSPTNLVTEMDRRAEALIVSALSARFPDHGILTEEAGALGSDGDHRWVVDPLDGTTNYAHGLPIYAVSIALEVEGQAVLGVVFDPSRDECFVAERGQGATLNGRALHVSGTSGLGDSVLATGFAYTIRDGQDTNLPEHNALALRCRAIREIGSAALSLAAVAAGRLDGFWELRLGAWDVAAGGLLVEEAGGQVTGLTGGALDPIAPAPVASNGHVHAEILRVLDAARSAGPR
jgi:myo-inositol-1(or 4)-monophosphatase